MDVETPGAVTVTLRPAQRTLLAQALADAEYYRDPPVDCPVCPSEDTLCAGCAAGLARARAYLHLGAELGRIWQHAPEPSS